MADKVHESQLSQLLDDSKVLKIQVEDELKKSFISYAMAVNVSRAIPDVRDGLKPVHRRILYAMNDLGLTHDKPHKKCARIVGEVLGKYHPHGDSAVYDALVRLAQDFSIREPLVDGQGNFGSIDGDPAAAQRYTEARLSRIANEMLRDIDKNTVDMGPNFDDSLEEPKVLPARFPNLLVNGSDGIAVGMATSIPPHNLGEVIDGTVALLRNTDISIEELMEYIPAPDFPTAGIILGRQNVRQAYLTGHGGVVMRARTEIEEYANGTRERIIVTELPYQVNKARLIENMADLVKDKKILGISNINDESDRDGMRIVIEVKRDSSAYVVLNTLFKMTQLQTSMGITFLALKDGRPKVLNLKEMLVSYVEHQKDVVVRRTKYDLDKARDREHILRGLAIALANIDEVVEVIKNSKETATAKAELMRVFDLSDKQAQAILDMRLGRLTSLEVDKITNELAELEVTIADYVDILANDYRVVQIIEKELLEVKATYNTPRKSELQHNYNEINIADLIEQEDVVVSMTHYGYVKRIPVESYKAQHRGGVGITAHKPKEEDFVENMFVANTHTDIMFFTDRGRVHVLKGYEIPEGERTGRGRAIVNLLQLTDGEKVTTLMPVSEGAKYLMLATRKGYIKKTSLDEFKSIRKVGKIAISLTEGDELISAQLTTGEDEIIMATSLGKCIRFSETDVRPMGRDTQGVRSMKLNEDDYVVDMNVIDLDSEVITVTSNGYGKRSPLSEYRLQGRAGKGVTASVINDETGRLVNLKLLKPGQDVMLIADNGIIIRVDSEEIRRIGRATKGVRIMKIKGDSKVVCISLAEHEEQTPETDADATAEAVEVVETTEE